MSGMPFDKVKITLDDEVMDAVSFVKHDLVNILQGDSHRHAKLFASMCLAKLYLSYSDEHVAHIYIVDYLVFKKIISSIVSEKTVAPLLLYAEQFDDIEFLKWLELIHIEMGCEYSQPTSGSNKSTLYCINEEMSNIEVWFVKMMQTIRKKEDVTFLRLVPAFIRLMNLLSQTTLADIFGLSRDKVYSLKSDALIALEDTNLSL